jgi:hypothetical protein
MKYLKELQLSIMPATEKDKNTHLGKKSNDYPWYSQVFIPEVVIIRNFYKPAYTMK